MKKSKLVTGLILLSILLVLSAGVGISIGSSPIPLSHSIGYLLHQVPLLDSFFAPTWTDTEATIIARIRLPRVLLGILVGASLSLAGAAFQGVLRNPLADPYILGVSAGASVGAALTITLGTSFAMWSGYSIPVASFMGAMLSIAAVFWIGRSERRLKTETLILAGVVVNAFFGAILIFIQSMAPDSKSQQILLWLMGSLGLRSWEHGMIVLPFFVLGFAVIWAFSRELNTLTMGEKGAASLGVQVERAKWVLLVSGSLLTAVAVSSAGIIGFVGLVIPHIIRLWISSDYRLLIPFSTLAGGTFLVLCDAVARSVMPPLELSIGVVTAAVGAPFFAWQLQRSRRGMS
ncbi:FecCD family ABC transporter permease [Effusibacillus lacus]|uniref:Iron ABC transporter n=1 Tax=Effusibacillus lacus TaxID=1348429 RepID=A0A292YSI1_9BACL|nr:iron ABC transporter permease [Effusibacillus lacus]TCS76052.1 iron complex transport system permease protein [Effusibacillus lacus]GAX91430.1 iron ABC transporter [Effusibacillus lacus]